jgi:hypothetical protein
MKFLISQFQPFNGCQLALLSDFLVAFQSFRDANFKELRLNPQVEKRW